MKRTLARLAAALGLLLTAPASRADDEPEAPELDGGIAWLNTDHPLRISELRGQVVILDFWTYS